MVISAVTAIGAPRRIRARSPSRLISATRVGHVLRGLPVGRFEVEGDVPRRDDGQHITDHRTGRLQRLPPVEHEARSHRPCPVRRLIPASSATYRVRGRVVTARSVPSWTTTPCSTMTSRSARAAASSGSWVTSTHDPPNSRRCRRSSWRTDPRRPTSRAAIGSSSSSSRGSTARARARATRWAWPPERRPGFVDACVGHPHPIEPLEGPARRLGLGRSPTAQAEGHVGLGAQVGEEEVVLEDHAARSVARAAPGCRGPDRRAPRRRARSGRPRSGWMPARARSSVDFPLPLGPSTATTSPSPTSSVTCSEKSPTVTPTSATRLTGRWLPATVPAGRPAPPRRWPGGPGTGRWPPARCPPGPDRRPAGASGSAPGCRRRT